MQILVTVQILINWSCPDYWCTDYPLLHNLGLTEQGINILLIPAVCQWFISRHKLSSPAVQKFQNWRSLFLCIGVCSVRGYDEPPWLFFCTFCGFSICLSWTKTYQLTFCFQAKSTQNQLGPNHLHHRPTWPQANSASGKNSLIRIFFMASYERAVIHSQYLSKCKAYCKINHW